MRDTSLTIRLLRDCRVRVTTVDRVAAVACGNVSQSNGKLLLSRAAAERYKTRSLLRGRTG